MDAWNRVYAQIVERFRAMTPGSRVFAGLFAISVALSLGYLAVQRHAPPNVDLMHGAPITVSQLPLMEAAFAKANLKDYEIRDAAIFVPRGKEASYMAALADGKALPPNFGSAMSEAISAANPFMSSRERDDRIKEARQKELALMIRSMCGIENAYVLYDVDNKPGLYREKVVTATAGVKPLGSGQLEEARVRAIRHLLAGAIAGLKPENVTVADLNGRTWYGSTDDAVAEENLYVSLKRTYEQDLKTKILNALGFIPNVIVEPSVTIDREAVGSLRQCPHGTPDSEQQRRQDARSRSANVRSEQKNSTFGRSGAAAVLDSLFGETPDSRELHDPKPTDDDATQVAERQSARLKPVLAQVSVGIPMSYFKKVWQQRYPDRPHVAPPAIDAEALDRIRVEESAKIQRHVAQLLPPAPGIADPVSLVTVTTFQDIAAETPPTDFRRAVFAWLVDSWQMLGIIGIVAIGGMVLRALLRERKDPAGLSLTFPDNIAEQAEEDAAPSRPTRGPGPPHYQPVEPALREELAELVQNDPDAAARILRTWIGQAN